MPGAVSKTSTQALTNATLPYVLQIADKGWIDAVRASEPLSKGVSTHDGALYNHEVAEALGYESKQLVALLA
jgi:alanine dehydrogenase